MDELQPITYRGRVMACACRHRVFLSAALERRAPTDPDLRFVLMMCCYARDVLTGTLPGPYTTRDARRYAQAALIPDELLDRGTLDNRRVARWLGVPEDELHAARADRAWRSAGRVTAIGHKLGVAWRISPTRTRRDARQ